LSSATTKHTEAASFWLLAHPLVLQVVQRLLGDDFICEAEAFVFKVPGNGKEVPVHCDGDPSQPDVMEMVFNVDYYLDDATPENGCLLAAPGSAWPQTTPFERLSAEQFDATPPSALVHGAPGRMSVRSTACRDLPAGETRRRIVDIAAQEWAFFGFYVIDQTGPSTRTRSSRGSRRWR